MKSTGIARKVDELGRIAIPIVLRRALDISVGNRIEISLEEDQIILRKYEAERICAVTGEVADENVESTYVKGLHLSPRGAAILLKELQSNRQE